jgi:Ni/Fe-hydrogenase subunit HybB-like protein
MPTWPEWASVLGAVALGLLVFTIGVKYFKILPSSERAAVSKEA